MGEKIREIGDSAQEQPGLEEGGVVVVRLEWRYSKC
jgi:hypothetical protein